MLTRYAHLTTEEVWRQAVVMEEIPQDLAVELMLRLEQCLQDLDAYDASFAGSPEELVFVLDPE